MDPETPSAVTNVLTSVTTLLEWTLESATDITTWVIGDSLGGIYIGMFIIGFAIAALFRVLHTA